MGGKQWAKEPLVVYTSPNKNLTNGSLYQADATVGSLSFGDKDLAGIFVGGQYKSSIEVWWAGVFAIYNLDATLYKKITINYQCGLGTEYTSDYTGDIHLGWGYSHSSGQVAYQQRHTPQAYASSGTATFDIEDIDGNICIGADASGGDVGYGAKWICLTSIILS